MIHNEATFMDDPLRPPSRGRHLFSDPISMDFVARLQFAFPPSSLRVFDSNSEKNQYLTVSTADQALELVENSVHGVRGLKIILGFGDGQRENLSTSPQDFCAILDACKFPREFPQSILTNNGSFARFTDYETVRGKEVPSSLSVILQTPYSPFLNFSCVLRANISDRSATCLFFLKERRKMDDLLKRLSSNRESLHRNPLSLISFLVQEHGYHSEVYRERQDKHVVDMERQTGHTSIAFSLFQPSPSNFEQLTRDLNACKTSLIFLDNTMAFEQELGLFCKETLKTFESLMGERRTILQEGEDGQPWLSVGEHVAAQQQLDYHLNLSQMRRIQAISLERRVQTQISVLYSLISQRDSKINILVAEDSKNIALSAKRDSTAMKTISIVTMVFLPGTFVASVFSAGIFNFQAPANEARIAVSKFWWVYFVVTIALTLATVVVWAFYTKQRNLEVARDDEEEKAGKMQ